MQKYSVITVNNESKIKLQKTVRKTITCTQTISGHHTNISRTSINEYSNQFASLLIHLRK